MSENEELRAEIERLKRMYGQLLKAYMVLTVKSLAERHQGSIISPIREAVDAEMRGGGKESKEMAI